MIPVISWEAIRADAAFINDVNNSARSAMSRSARVIALALHHIHSKQRLGTLMASREATLDSGVRLLYDARRCSHVLACYPH